MAAFLFLQSETPTCGMIMAIFVLRVFPPGLYFSRNTLTDTPRSVFSRQFYNDQCGLLSVSLFNHLVTGWRRQRKGFLKPWGHLTHQLEDVNLTESLGLGKSHPYNHNGLCIQGEMHKTTDTWGCLL